MRFEFTYSIISIFRRKKAFSILCIAILLLSFLFVSNLPMRVGAQSSSIFSNGFESGDLSGWTGAEGLVNVESNVAQAGNYAIQTSLSNQQGYVYENMPTQNSVYVEYYVYFEGLSNIDGTFLSVGGVTANSNFLCYLRADYYNRYNSVVWHFVSYNNGVDEVYNLNTQNPQNGTWIKIAYQVTVDSTNGTYNLWINDTNILSVSGKNTANWGGITQVYVGDHWNNVGSGNLYCDSVTVETSMPKPTTTLYLTCQFNMTATVVPLFYNLSDSWNTISGNPSQQHTFQPVHSNTIIEVDKPVDSDIWKYFAYDSDPVGSQIYLYYSNDTSGMWTAYSGNPVLSASDDYYRWPSTTFVNGIFYMFIEDYSESTLQLWTSQDGVNYTFLENVKYGGNQYKNPFIWFDTNENQWYLYSHDSVGTTESIVVRSASTLDGLQSASDTIVVSRDIPFGSATMMYHGGTYWLLAEILSGSEWQVVAYCSTTSASSGFVEIGNSPILTNDEACPMIFLTPDQSHAYIFTTVNKVIWYITTREIYINSGNRSGVDN